MKRIQCLLALLTCLLCMHSVVWAQAVCPLNGQFMKPKQVSSLDAFKRIAVLDGGRVKPLDTYARNILLQFSGRQHVGKKGPVEWLAELVFSPEATSSDKVFLINNPAIPEALGIEVEKKTAI